MKFLLKEIYPSLRGSETQSDAFLKLIANEFWH